MKLILLLMASILWSPASKALVHPARRTWANYRAHAVCRRATVGQKFVIEAEVQKAHDGFYKVTATKKEDLTTMLVEVSDFDAHLVCRLEVTNNLVTALPK